jgi:hypothetical protein
VQASDGSLWLVADDGKILSAAGDAAQSDTGKLPLVVPASSFAARAGSRLPTVIAQALGVTTLLGAADVSKSLPTVAKITVSAGGQVVVVFQGGAELRLGDPVELKDKLMVSIGIIEQYLRDGKQLLYADVSVPSRAVAKPK